MFLFLFYGAKLQLFFELAKFFGNYFQFILIFFFKWGRMPSEERLLHG